MQSYRGTATRETVRAGLIGGVIGGVAIWIYEAIVWVGVQHLLPLGAIPANAVGLVFGKSVQMSLGPVASVLGTAIHFGFAMLWGIVFALLWIRIRRPWLEATLVALGFAVVLWVVMHLAIAITSSDHPDYLDPVVVIGGILSHIFYAVPLALFVKRRLDGPGAVQGVVRRA